MTVVRMRHLTDAPRIIGEAVLRGFPLRLWDRHQQHMDAILRELQLVVGAARIQGAPEVPPHLSDAAEMFSMLFGTLVDAVDAACRHAGADEAGRVDVRVTLVDRTPDLLDHLGEVLEAVDEYCAGGNMLTLARPPEMIALAGWIMSELTAQYYGAAPTPWAGPF